VKIPSAAELQILQQRRAQNGSSKSAAAAAAKPSVRSPVGRLLTGTALAPKQTSLEQEALRQRRAKAAEAEPSGAMTVNRPSNAEIQALKARRAKAATPAGGLNSQLIDPEERRFDTDGGAYTYAEFEGEYGAHAATIWAAATPENEDGFKKPSPKRVAANDLRAKIQAKRNRY